MIGYIRYLSLTTAMVLLLAGCGPTANIVKTGQKEQVKPQAAAPATADTAVPAEPKPEVKAAPAPVVKDTVEEQKRKRRIELEFNHAVESYYELLVKKDVNRALMLVAPESREAQKGILWAFVSRFRLEGYETFKQDITYVDRARGVSKTMLTIFERRSVVPQKTEMILNWEYRGKKWFVIP